MAYVLNFQHELTLKNQPAICKYLYVLQSYGQKGNLWLILC